MTLRYDNTRTRHRTDVLETAHAERKTPLELFGELYEKQNGRPLDGAREAYLMGLIESIWEGEA